MTRPAKRLPSSYVLRWPCTGWFRDYGPIGPRLTTEKSKAHVFASAEDARRSHAYSHPLCAFVVERLNTRREPAKKGSKR
jgi:hypothetical protein